EGFLFGERGLLFRARSLRCGSWRGLPLSAPTLGGDCSSAKHEYEQNDDWTSHNPSFPPGCPPDTLTRVGAGSIALIRDSGCGIRDSGNPKSQIPNRKSQIPMWFDSGLGWDFGVWDLEVGIYLVAAAAPGFLPVYSNTKKPLPTRSDAYARPCWSRSTSLIWI